MSHTPGPWHANGLEVGVAVHGRAGMQTIAIADQLDAPHPAIATTAYDNALLIAAAPELLESCKQLLLGVDEYWSENNLARLQYARNAIAKATTRKLVP